MIIATLNGMETKGDGGSLGVGMNECRFILITHEFICEPAVGKFENEMTIYVDRIFSWFKIQF